MKILNVSIILLLAMILFVPIFRYCKNNPTPIADQGNITNTEFSNYTDESDIDAPISLTAETIEEIMQDIDDRVLWIRKYLGAFTPTDGEGYKNDCYDGNSLVYRRFCYDYDQDSFAEYILYYDEYENLIYAHITHYRSAMYSIYFHNDELLHVAVGPFFTGGSFINGDLAHAEAVIKEDASYAFVLEDLVRCLEHAYK